MDSSEQGNEEPSSGMDPARSDHLQGCEEAAESMERSIEHYRYVIDDSGAQNEDLRRRLSLHEREKAVRDTQMRWISRHLPRFFSKILGRMPDKSGYDLQNTLKRVDETYKLHNRKLRHQVEVLQQGIREESGKAAAAQNENEVLRQQLAESQTGAVSKDGNDRLSRELEEWIQRATASENQNEGLQELLADTSQKLTLSKRRNEELREELHRNRKTPSRENEEIRQRLEEMTQRAAFSKRENEGLQERLEDKSQKLALSRQINEALRQQLEEERQRVAAFKGELSTALQEVQSTGLGPAIKVADNEIHARWMDLRYQIRDFVCSKLVRSVPRAAVTPGMVESFQDLVSAPSASLESPYLAPTVFEARIWKYLRDFVFNTDSNIWAGKLGRLFYSRCFLEARGLIGKHSPFKNVFHDWRARSATLIVQISPVNKTAAQLLAVSLEADLAPFTLADTDHACGWAQQVVSAAVGLDLIFRRSRAFFKVCLIDNRHSTKYDEWSMVERGVGGIGPDPQDQSSQQVSIVVVPGLEKFGNSEGRNHDSSLMLEKMEVVCGIAALGPLTRRLARDELANG